MWLIPHLFPGTMEMDQAQVWPDKGKYLDEFVPWIVWREGAPIDPYWTDIESSGSGDDLVPIEPGAAVSGELGAPGVGDPL